MIYELLGADGGNQQMKSLAKNLIEQLKMEITNKSTIQQQPEEAGVIKRRLAFRAKG